MGEEGLGGGGGLDGVQSNGKTSFIFRRGSVICPFGSFRQKFVQKQFQRMAVSLLQTSGPGVEILRKTSRRAYGYDEVAVKVVENLSKVWRL